MSACDDEPSRVHRGSIETAFDTGLIMDMWFNEDDAELTDIGRLDHGNNDLSPLDMSLESPLSDERGSGIFREGCPKHDFAHARILNGPGELEGEAVIADDGDLLLMNDRAAFVIQDPTRPSRTWWYYGGQVVDAVPLRDCEQADEDRLNSLGIVVAEGQVTELDQATLRAFEGQSAEVISDGQGGGEARIRIYGHDAPMWLVEFELLSRAMKAGRPKLRSEELVVDMWIDYVLPPNQSSLQVEIGVINKLNESRVLRMSALSFFGDKAHEHRFAPDQISLAGIRLYTGLPWLSAGNLALTLNSGNMATAHFAGVDLFIDLNRFITGDRFSSWSGSEDIPSPLDLSQRPDIVTWEMSLAVHEEGLSNASRALATKHPRPSPARLHEPQEIMMTINPSFGESIDLLRLLRSVDQHELPAHLTVYQRQARVELWVFNAIGESLGQVGEHWLAFDLLRSGEPTFLSIPGLLKEGETYELRINIPGLPELRSRRFRDDQGRIDLLSGISLPPRGGLVIKVRNEQQRPLPATLRLTPLDPVEMDMPPGFTLYPRSELVHIIEESHIAIAPGRYRYTLTRGFEYEPVYGQIEVIPGEVGTLERSLRHLNPIDQYLSFDGHVHAGPSPDSDVLVSERLRGAAAEGVEIVAGTDHEIITDWSVHLTPQLMPWVTTVIAEESTATLPEHMNIYPLPARVDMNRGDPPQWYGLGFDRFIEQLTERGSPVIQLNHPRQGCKYLCLIGYDRETGEPDPSLNALNFGYDDGEVWGWGFNAVELLNDSRPLFIDLNRPQETGFFEDWASFINLGHKVTGMGVTDIHGRDGMGTPITLLKFTDHIEEVTPLDITPEDVAEAIVKGKAQVSLGAWVDINIEGAQLGELATATFNVPADGSSQVELSLTVKALPSVDIQWVYVFLNCDLLFSWPADEPYELIKHQQNQIIELTSDAWVTVMAFGDEPMPDGLPQYDPRVTPRVITNPIYIDADRNGEWTAPGGKTCLIPDGRRP